MVLLLHHVPSPHHTFITPNHSFWLPTSSHVRPQTKKTERILGGTVKVGEGNAGRDLQAGTVLGSTSELHRGMVHVHVLAA